MSTRYMERKSGTTGMRTFPGATPFRYDTADDKVKFQDDDGTTIRKVVSEDQTQTLTNKTLTSPTITSPTLSGDGINQVASVSLTNAEMLALRATPKTLVAAPGAGYMLEFVSAQLFFDYTAAYTETADNLAVRLGDGSGTIVSQAIEATGFVDATADTMTNALPKIDAIVSKTNGENKALVLHNTGDGEWGGGNAANAVRVKVVYRVWPTGF